MTDKEKIITLERRIGELIRDKQDFKEETEFLRNKVKTKTEDCAVCVLRHGCKHRYDNVKLQDQK